MHTKVDSNRFHRRASVGSRVQSTSNPLQLGETGKGFLEEAACKKGFKDKEFHKEETGMALLEKKAVQAKARK